MVTPFVYLEKHHFGRYPQYSLYLLQVISFLCSYTVLVEIH